MFWSKPIVRPGRIPLLISEQRMDVWVCSYGGSGTNMIADYLSNKSLRIQCPIWRELICHHAGPTNVAGPTKAIYIFGDPVLAFESMKRRRTFAEVNLCKLTNRQTIRYSDERLFRAMLKQFQNWTRPNTTNLDILAIKFEDVFTVGKQAIADFLGVDTGDFPARRSRKGSASTAVVRPFMKKYLRQIEAIRQFSSFARLLPCPSYRPEGHWPEHQQAEHQQDEQNWPEQNWPEQAWPERHRAA